MDEADSALPRHWVSGTRLPAFNGDLAAVQSLVAPSAQEDLAQMLASLAEPSGCKVMGVGGSGESSEVQVGLLFADGKSQQPDFTLTIVVGSDKATITAIKPTAYPSPSSFRHTVTTAAGGTTAGFSMPVIQVQAEAKLPYLNPDCANCTAEAVVLGTVVEVLPLRRSPLAGTGDPDGPKEHKPIVYKGYFYWWRRPTDRIRSPGGSPSTPWGTGPSCSTG